MQGPSVGYLQLKENYSNEAYEEFSIAGKFGYQWFISKQFSADLLSGLGFLVGSETNTEELSFGIGLSGIGVVSYAGIGICLKT